MANKLIFTEEEMVIDEGLGYSKAYSKLCRNPNIVNPYSHGPPFAFVPYVLQPHEALRVKDLNQMFPVTDPDANPTVKPRSYVNLLWKQLDHLGNAGFDPALFRVDPYGNVLYLHADSASPLAWDIDHWFPCSRGGRTVPSNLRLLQWQVCKKKKNKLDFLVPWWDLQLGISVNQFLSIFASRNSDFRNRAFSYLFWDGGNEELNALQGVESHIFPQHFIELKRQVGLAPAAIVSSQRSSDALVLKPIDINNSKSLRPNSPLTEARKFSSEDDDTLSKASQRFRPNNSSKENDKPDLDSNNPYLAITMARDSLRQREETRKKQAEISQLEEELNELKQKNEMERVALQDLEEVLIKRRRRVEKCRRLAESQSSYRTLLEKMIRDAMHQSVVYKEQVRLNQAASSALMARLEAQRAICDSSEKELHKRFKQRDEIEKQIRPCQEQARKRSRTDETLFEERREDGVQLLSTRRTRKPLKKELRVFLEEEQKASEAGLSRGEEEEEEEAKEEETEVTIDAAKDEEYRTMIAAKDEISHNDKLTQLAIGEGHFRKTKDEPKKSLFPRSQFKEDEEYRTVISAKDEISHDDMLTQLAIGEGHCRKTKDEPKKSVFPRSQFKEDDDESRTVIVDKDGILLYDKLKKLTIREGQCSNVNEPKRDNLLPQTPHEEYDEEYRNQVGKGNIEKWLQMLLENTQEGSSMISPPQKPDRVDNYTDNLVDKLNLINPQKEIKFLKLKPSEEKAGFEQKIKETGTENRKKEVSEMSSKMCEKSYNTSELGSSSTCIRKSFEGGKERGDRRGLVRCDSARGFRSFPSSPSMILGMRRSVDCMGKKPKVLGDDDDDNDDRNGDSVTMNNNSKFIKTCTRTIKKAVNK